MAFRLVIDGDAISGWIAEIHDGALKIYRSAKGELLEVIHDVLGQHFETPAPTPAQAQPHNDDKPEPPKAA